MVATATAVLSGGKAPAPPNNSTPPPPIVPSANGEPGAAPLAGAGATLSSDAVRKQQTQRRRQLQGASEDASDGGSEVTDSEMLDAQLNAAAVAVRAMPPPSDLHVFLVSLGPRGFREQDSNVPALDLSQNVEWFEAPRSCCIHLL